VDTSTQLFLSFIVGTFGLAYFVYGKKQKRFIPTLSGIAMMVYPYFVKNLVLSLALALVCLVIPFVISE
jgi:ABC-type phosphate transport system permease subunit